MISFSDASKLGQSCGSGLAQAVGRAMRQPGMVALLAKPVAKAVGAERFAKLGDEEGRLAGGAGRKNILQFWPQRNFHLDWLPLPVFLLGKHQPTFRKMMRTQQNRVATPLTRVTHQSHGQPRFAADRMRGVAQIPTAPAAPLHVPSSAVSSLGGFRTPAAEHAATS